MAKSFEELDVLDDFLMNAVAGDPDVGETFCRTLLSVLLNREIGGIRVVTQRLIPGAGKGQRAVQMDVEIEEYGEDPAGPKLANVYDVEPHLQRDLHFPRHNRFYQAKIDSRYMKRGEKDFRKLPDLYVLTITDFDPFQCGQMIYHVRNRCDEVPELEYDDGLHFLYYYTDGKKGGSQAVRNLLQYMKDSRGENATDEATSLLHECVSHVKVSPEVKVEFMRFEEIVYYRSKDAVEAARKEASEAATKIATELTTKATTKQDIFDILEDLGEVPEALRERISRQEDVETLRKWLKFAAKAVSFEEFESRIAGQP